MIHQTETKKQTLTPIKSKRVINVYLYLVTNDDDGLLVAAVEKLFYRPLFTHFVQTILSIAITFTINLRRANVFPHELQHNHYHRSSNPEWFFCTDISRTWKLFHVRPFPHLPPLLWTTFKTYK